MAIQNSMKSFAILIPILLINSFSTAAKVLRDNDSYKAQDVVENTSKETMHQKCPNDDYLPEDPHFSTKAIHCGYEPSANSSWALVPPIHMSSAFKMATPNKPRGDYQYARMNNPDRNILEKYLAAVEEARHTLVFSSGMAAISTITQLLKPGDHILSIDTAHGGTAYNFELLLKNFNISVSYHNFLDLENLPTKVTSRTKLIWLESPTSFFMEILDIDAIVRIVKAKNNKALVALDNTFQTPFFQKALKLSVDVVVYSLKYINGHSDVIMGAIATNDENIFHDLRMKQILIGAVPSPFDCYLVIRGLKTLNLRMKEHMNRGLEIAKFLSNHPAVKHVHHPGLETHPNHCLSKKQWSGFSGMFSFSLTGDQNDTLEFTKLLKYIPLGSGFGGFETMITVFCGDDIAHNAMKKRLANAADNLIRMSVGLESVEDIKADLKYALDVAVLKKDPSL